MADTNTQNIANINGALYFKETPPTQAEAGDTAYVIHGNVSITRDMYLNNTMDGDTLLIKQNKADYGSDIEVKTNYSDLLKVRFIGINCPEVQHYEPKKDANGNEIKDDKGNIEYEAVFKTTDNKWTPVDQLNDTEKARYNEEKVQYDNGGKCLDLSLQLLGIDVASLKTKTTETFKSNEIVVVIDKLQTMIKVDDNAPKTIGQAGMDVYGRYLSAIYLKHPKTGDWVNLNKTLLLQSLGVTVLIFEDANGKTNLSPVFKIADYKTIYEVINNNDVKPPAQDKTGTIDAAAVDDRLTSAINLGFLKNGFESWTTVLGDTVLFIPPSSINVSKNTFAERVKVVRSKSSIEKGSGYSDIEIKMSVFFDGPDMINGYKYTDKLPNGTSIDYHVHGLRQLISQFRKTPFLPIINNYLNYSYGIEAVTLTNITVSTVPGMPGLIRADLIMTDFEPRTYIMGLDATENMGQLVHWPAFRYYYQKSFDEKCKDAGHTYLKPVPDKLTGDFKMSIIKAGDLDRMAQMANLIALNKINDNVNGGQKSVEDQLLQYNIVGQAKDNFEAYTKMMNGYAEFLKKYSELVDDDKKSRKIVVGLIKEDDSFIKERTDNYGDICLPLTVQYPFMYLRKDTDYLLADKFYKDYKLIIPTKTMTEYKVKMEDNNDFFMHNDFGVKHSLGRVTWKHHNFGNTTSSKVGYAIMLAANGLKDMFVAMAGSKPVVLTPDMITFNFEPQNLCVDGFLDDDLQKIHKEFCSNFDWVVNEKEANIPSGIVAKKKEYDTAYKTIQSIDDAKKDKKNTDKLQHQNWLDDLEFDFEAIDIPFSPTAINVGFANTFANLQVLNFNTPTKQYMGGTDTVIQAEYTVVGKDAIHKFNYIYEYCTHIVRQYRSYISQGFLKIDNELVNMAGVEYVSFNSIDISEVPEYPETYNVRLTFVAFDRTQRNKEELKKMFSGSEEYIGPNTDQKNQEVTNNYQNFITNLKDSEVYPDLELPTVAELADKGFAMTNTTSRFPDPDFYMSYKDRLLISDVVKKYIVDPTSLGQSLVFDAHTGDSLTFDASKPLSQLVPSSIMKESTDKIEAALKNSENAIKTSTSNTTDQSKVREKTVSDYIATEKESYANGGTDYYPGGQVAVIGMTFGLANGKSADKGTSENITKLKDRFTGAYYKVTSDENGFINTDMKANEVHQKIDELCEKFNVPDDTVVRGIIHTFAQNESDAYQWKTFNSSKPIPKGNSINVDDKSTWKDGTKVGVMGLDFAGHSYDDSELNDCMFNPAVNIHYGLVRLIEAYKTTFDSIDGGKYGLYSKFEEVGSQTYEDVDNPNSSNEKTETPRIGDTWTKVTKDIAKEAIEFLTEDLKDMWNTVAKKEYWAEGGGGHGDTNLALVAFYKDPQNDGPVATIGNDNANVIETALRTFKDELQAFVDGDKETMADPPKETKKETTKASAYGTVSYSGGGKADLSYERARWFVACLVVKGLADKLEANSFSSLRAFIENSFSASAFTGIDSGYSDYCTSFFSNVMKHISTQQLLTQVAVSASDYKASGDKTTVDVSYFEDFSGDPTFVIRDDDVFKNSFSDTLEFDKRGRLCRAFPSFFVCIIDEGNTIFNWKMHDNFYGYNSISDIKVFRSRKMAASTCTIQMSNMFNAFWNWDENSLYQRQSSFVDVYDSIFNTEDYVKNAAAKTRNADTNKSMIKPGARLHVRMGYSADVRHMPIMFNGTITEIEQGDVIQMIAQGDGIELCNKIPASPKDTTEGNAATDGDSDIFTRFLGYMTGATSEPRNVILDMFHTKGGFWSKLIYNLTNGYFANKNALGMVHLGNPEFKLIFKEGGEVGQNVYAGVDPIIKQVDGKEEMIAGMDDSANMFADNDEVNFSMYLYNKTPWDVIQVCRMLIPGFVASVEPFEFRSTLFYGKKYYPMAYQYDYSTVDYDNVKDVLSKIVTTDAASAKTETTTTTTTTPTTTATASTGDGNQGTIWNFLKSKGLDDNASAAIMGNMQQENGAFDPSVINGIGAAGICQWYQSRLDNLKAFAQQKGTQWNDLNTQLEFLYSELQSRGMVDKVNGKTDLDATTIYFEQNFEVSGDTGSYPNRIQYAKNFLTKYAGKTPTGGSGSSGSSTTNTITKAKGPITNYLNVNAASPIKEMRKTFQQTHIITSQFDIIDNKIKASERGVYTNVLGSFVGQGAGQTTKSYQTPIIYSDTDIWDEKQKTALVDCQYLAKGVPLLGLIPFVNSTKTFFFDQWKATNIATSALEDYMKDMYQGEMIVTGFPSMKPHDVMYLYDDYNQMSGLCEVQQVIHSFSVDGGFVTSVTPDACTTQHDQFEKNKWMLTHNVGATLAVYFAAKIAAAAAGMRLFGFTRFGVGVAGKMINTGLNGLNKVGDILGDGKAEVMKNIEKAIDIEKITDKATDAGSKLSKVKTMVSKQIDSLSSIVKELGNADENAASAIKSIIKHGDDFAAAFKVGKMVAGCTELAIGLVIERAAYTWVKRYIRNRQAIAMTLLRQHGRELSAGINGHKGLVVGDSPGLMDTIITGLFDNDVSKFLFGDELAEIANTTYSRKTGTVNALDAAYRDKYVEDYIADSSNALAEIASLMTSNTKNSADQTGRFINGNGTTGVYNNEVIDYGCTFIGVPYVWNGKDPSGFDCSGLMTYIFKKFDVYIGDGTLTQETKGIEVAKDQIKKGDLIFWGAKGHTYHVAIYVGDNQILVAPQTGQNVKIENLWGDWWARRICDFDSSGKISKSYIVETK